MPDTSDAPPAAAGFAAFGLHPQLVEALTGLGYEEPTPIQREALPPLLEGRDVLGLAATGTGKTAAFSLPLLQRLSPAGERGPGEPGALVLAPTRELAVQVAEALHTYSRGLGTRVLSVYGGTNVVPQLKTLRRGVDVVVATPGRALDLVRRKSLSLARVSYVVLDEADEMLDMGFADELEALLEALPEEHQTALFSATLPARISAIAEKHLHAPVEVKIAREKAAPGALPRVRQQAYLVKRPDREAALVRVLQAEAPASALIFCRTRNEVDALSTLLLSRGFRAEALHGGLSQEQRDRVMRRFKEGQVQLLVATDVAARGLHIEGLSHVINYEAPSSHETYVHRVGRTGRAGKEGVAITFAGPREVRLLELLGRAVGQKLEVARVPNAAELRARQLERTRARVQEALAGGAGEEFRALADTLLEEGEPAAVLAAALQLVHTAHAPAAEADTRDIPSFLASPAAPRGLPERARREEGEGPRRWQERPPREGAPPAREARWPGAPAEGAPERRWQERPPRPPREGREEGGERPPRRAGPPQQALATLVVNLGKKAGVRPADLVGAISNEAGLPARMIGAIEVGEVDSRVELPARDAARVMAALRATTLRGRKVSVHMER